LATAAHALPPAGVDFYPAVVKLQQALKTLPPEQFKNVRFTATDAVTEWPKKRRK
jgi:hypothetical protein